MEILDILEELEGLILRGKKGLLSDSKMVLVNKQELLDLIDVVRRLVNEKYQALKTQLNGDQVEEMLKSQPSLYKNKQISDRFKDDSEAYDIVTQAKQQAAEIKQEIDDYSDKVLENLKLTVTKMKGKLLKLDTVIDLSRERIKKTAHYAELEEDLDDYHNQTR